MNKDVLVTGSSRGIGRAIAEKLADQGFGVVLHCRSSREQADAVATSIEAHGGRARVLQFDVADRQAAADALNADIEAHGCYYGVVCNAGLTADNAFPAMSGEDWDRVIHTNLDGFYNVLHPIIMPMVRARRGGRIITMASVSGLLGNRGQANYAASKAGLIAASKSLALELGKRRITVNCIAPGLIDTEMLDEHVVENAMKLIPLRRLGQSEEVAAMAGFLMSDDAAYITRQVIAIDGGLS